MCGIAAIIGKFASQDLKLAVQRMLNAQVHRGPDDGGLTVIDAGESKVGLGNRRLAILDLSPHGHQPMVNADSGDTVVYNGEIYNSPELKGMLESHGFRFCGHSDTEILLRAYQHWGIDCLQHLKGMFAFALWDHQRQRLILARDHLGIKPLYYSVRPGKGLVCASEIRALLAGGLVNFEVDSAALAGYLAYGAVQEPLTIIKGVSSLPPGSWVEVDRAGEISARGTYWNFPAPDESRSGVNLSDLVEEGRTLLRSAVKRHLLSDVPVGVFLSSGLDSTAVLKLACEVTSTKVHAFTVSTPDSPEIDEAPLAVQSIQGLDVVHHVLPVDSAKALAWARDGMNSMDQPAMDGLNTYMVSRAVRAAGIKCALSGQGGDEVFGGYRSFRAVPQWHRRLRLFCRLPRPIQRGLVRVQSARLDEVAKGKVSDIARNGIGLSGLYFQTRRLLSDSGIATLGFDSRALNLSSSYHVSNLDTYEQTGSRDPIAMVSRLESKFYLGNTLLRDGDVFGMANSLEIRVPLLDKDLVDWAFRLPGDTLLPKGAPPKFLLRQMCADYYTSAQTKQSKLGFNLPISSWLLGPLRDVMEDSLHQLKNSGLMAPLGIDQVKAAFLQEPQTAAWSRVWGLMTLGHWLTNQNTAVPSI